MGIPLFGQDISGAVKRAMASGLPKLRLLKRQVGQELSPSTAGLQVSYRSYPCRGFEDNSEEARRAGSDVQRSGRLVLIIGDTLPSNVVPAPGDRIDVLGETLEILGEGVTSDPAKATYLCACSG